MLIHTCNWAVSSSSLDHQVSLAVRPLFHNCYSCWLSPREARVFSDAVLECAARVECKCGGGYDGLLWRPTYNSVLDLAFGGAVAVESHATSIDVTILRRRSYSIAVAPMEALELAYRLWVHSQPTVIAV
jgi:hypothetical protein